MPLVAASAPFWTRTLRDAQATRIVQVEGREQTMAAHLAEVVPRLHEPLGAVLGTHVPVIPDSEDFVLHAPGWRAGLIVLLYGFLLVLAGRATQRGRHPALLCFLAALLALLAFPFPLRSAPHTIRFLTPLYLPVAALVAWATAPRGTSRRSWVVVLALAALHLVGATQLLAGLAQHGPRRGAVPRSRTSPRCAASSTSTACATRTRPTGRRSGSPGRAASG